MTNAGYSSPNRTQGFALVLSLLFTGIVLLIVVSTAASLVTGTRQGGANERVSYQSMLVAESGLNTLPRRAAEYVRTKPYTGTLQSDLQVWLTGSASATNNGGLLAYLNDSTKNPAAGNTTKSLTALTPTTFTAVSAAALSTSAKEIAQDYAVLERTLPPGVKPNSGLLAIPKIQASGSSSVQPSTTSNAPKLVGAFSVGSAQTTIKVTSVNGLQAGDYVSDNGTTMRIDAVAAATASLTVTKVPTTSTTTANLANNSTVSLILNAAAETVNIVSSPMVLKASNVTDFSIPETVSVTVGTTKYVATISSVNAATKTITLSWVPSTSAPTSIPEGTALSRNTLAMASSSSVGIDPNASNKLYNFQGVQQGTVANDCTTTTTCAGTNTISQTLTPSQFTEMLLGLTDAELNDLVPLTTTAPSPAFANDANIGIIRINSTLFNTIFASNKTYNGVIIVDDAITQNLTGTTLNGLLYLRGGMSGVGNNAPKFTGSMVVNGTIAVYGTPNDTTSVLNGNVSINYSPMNLKLGFSSATGSRGVDMLAGTWRQQ